MSTARKLYYMRDETAPELTEEFLTWMRKLEVRTEEIDESSLEMPPDLILLGAKSETFAMMNPLTAEGSSYVVLDNDPPKQVPTGVFRITTADMSGATNEWKTLLHLIGRQIGMMSLPFRAQEIFEEGDGLVNIDFEQLQEAQLQEEHNKAERTTNDFIRAGGVEMARLLGVSMSEMLEDPTYSEEVGLAFVSSTYAAKRAVLSQKRAIDELGKSFSHTKRKYAQKQWGRIRWADDGDMSNIVYEGETDGVDAHGYGVLQFKGRNDLCTYKGQFIRGYRAGFGIGKEKLFTWVGAWFNDCPDGHGVFMRGKKKSDTNLFLGEIISIEEQKRQFKSKIDQKMDSRRVQLDIISQNLFG